MSPVIDKLKNLWNCLIYFCRRYDDILYNSAVLFIGHLINIIEIIRNQQKSEIPFEIKFRKNAQNKNEIIYKYKRN